MTRSVWILAASLFLLYNLNLRAIGSRDTHVTEFTALSLAADGDEDLREYPALVETGLARGYMTRTPGGAVVSNYPLAPAVIAAPAYWLAVRVGWIDPTAPVDARVEAVGKAVASALVSIAGALLFVMTSRQHGRRVALAVMIAIALGTPLWSSASQALWTHAPAAAALAAALLLIGNGGPTRAAAAGAAFGVAATCRPLLIAFLIGALTDLLRTDDRRSVWLGTGALLVLIPIAAYNIIRFDSALGGLTALEAAAVHQQTHLVSGAWSGNLVTGLAGIAVSPNRGIVVYSPILLFASVGAWRARENVSLLLRVVAPMAAYLIAWGQYAVWWGGHSYGPRYAADIAIPAGVLLGCAWSTPPWRRGASVLRAAFVCWSVAVQAIGAFCYPGGAWNSIPADVDRAHDRLWDWRDSQIVRTVTAGMYAREEARRH